MRRFSSEQEFIDYCAKLTSQDEVSQCDLEGFPRHSDFPYYTFRLMLDTIPFEGELARKKQAITSGCIRFLQNHPYQYRMNMDEDLLNQTVDIAISVLNQTSLEPSITVYFLYLIKEDTIPDLFTEYSSHYQNQDSLYTMKLLYIVTNMISICYNDINFVTLLNSLMDDILSRIISQQTDLAVIYQSLSSVFSKYLQFSKNIDQNVQIHFLQIIIGYMNLFDSNLIFSPSGNLINSISFLCLKIVLTHETIIEEYIDTLHLFFEKSISLLQILLSTENNSDIQNSLIYVLGSLIKYQTAEEIEEILPLLIQGSTYSDFESILNFPEQFFNVLFDLISNTDLYTSENDLRTICATYLIKLYEETEEVQYIIDLFKYSQENAKIFEFIYLFSSWIQYLIDTRTEIEEDLEQIISFLIGLSPETELEVCFLFLFFSILPFFGNTEIVHEMYNHIQNLGEVEESIHNSQVTFLFRAIRNSISLDQKQFLNNEIFDIIWKAKEMILNNEFELTCSEFIHKIPKELTVDEKIFESAQQLVIDLYDKIFQILDELNNEKEKMYQDIINREGNNINSILKSIPQCAIIPDIFEKQLIVLEKIKEYYYNKDGLVSAISPLASNPEIFSFYLQYMADVIDNFDGVYTCFVYDIGRYLYVLFDNNPEILDKTDENNVFYIQKFLEKFIPYTKSDLENIDCEFILLIFIKCLFVRKGLTQESKIALLEMINSFDDSFNQKYYDLVKLAAFIQSEFELNEIIISNVINNARKGEYPYAYERALISTAFDKMKENETIQAFNVFIKANFFEGEYEGFEFPDYKLIPGFNETDFLDDDFSKMEQKLILEKYLYLISQIDDD